MEPHPLELGSRQRRRGYNFPESAESEGYRNLNISVGAEAISARLAIPIRDRNGDIMPTSNVLWGDPLPEPTPSLRQKPKPRRRFVNEIPTDILAWLAQNEPQEFRELTRWTMPLPAAIQGSGSQVRAQEHYGNRVGATDGPPQPLAARAAYSSALDNSGNRRRSWRRGHSRARRSGRP